jgi:uncharacterized protein YndB with AHSA1/START domain
MAVEILLGIAVAIILLLLVIATRPSVFHVERSIAIDRPPANAFALVNDFHAWASWSPFERLDPQMKKTFEGAAAGAGAIYTWSGNDKAGQGRMTIQKSDEPSLISIQLQFLKPWNATNIATFTFVPEANGTKVTWAMDGQKNFALKAFSLFMNMDRMLGSDFERGLAAMKTAAESSAK